MYHLSYLRCCRLIYFAFCRVAVVVVEVDAGLEGVGVLPEATLVLEEQQSSRARD